MRLFGILYLDDKRTDIDDKGNHLKRFTSYYNTKTNFSVKTKRKEMHRTYAIINTSDNSVNEYISDDTLNENIFNKMATCNWSQKINKIEIDPEIDYYKSERIEYNADIISVDPDGCVDIDDAISYKINNNNKIELGIHIADPSSYIDIKSNIGNELLVRCESVYLDKTHHMIPEQFGLKYISLKQNEIKRSYSLIIEFNTNNITEINKCLLDKNYSYKFIKTNIIVKSNLSYDEFEKNMNTFNKNIYDIGKEIFNGLNIGYTEYDSHKMIEAYMILCNHLSANHTYIKRGFNNISAIYTTNDIIHKELGLKYTHMTSPMRRIIDFINHIIIFNQINQTEQTNQKINLDYINSIHKYYKKIYNIRTIDKLIGLNDSITTDATIILIEENKLTLCINNMYIYIKVFDQKLIDNKIIEIIYICSNYIIYKYKDQHIRYEINQKINISIYRQKLEIQLFKTMII
jgi:hypothetical protein